MRVRIQRAKLLFAETDMSVKAVARRSGFPSFKNLSRLFLREVGVTPLAFCKAHRRTGRALSESPE